MSSKAKKKTVEAPPVGQAEAISKHLGARVKALRGERGWSLEALANLLLKSSSFQLSH